MRFISINPQLNDDSDFDIDVDADKIAEVRVAQDETNTRFHIIIVMTYGKRYVYLNTTTYEQADAEASSLIEKLKNGKEL